MSYGKNKMEKLKPEHHMIVEESLLQCRLTIRKDKEGFEAIKEWAESELSKELSTKCILCVGEEK